MASVRDWDVDSDRQARGWVLGLGCQGWGIARERCVDARVSAGDCIANSALRAHAPARAHQFYMSPLSHAVSAHVFNSA